MDGLRIHINEFESYEQAEEARRELPFCATCRSRTKIQRFRERWLVMCMLNPHHFGMRQGKDFQIGSKRGRRAQ